ncbi:MAG: TlyA family RNA methyltransferase [Pseudomonadota bacterium]
MTDATARGGSERLDQRLVSLGLVETRARAQALIKAGVVRVDGAPARKPSASPPPDARIELVADPCPWVSRAALKLLHALERFELSPEGAETLDVGASTGGFTEVCLARGAARVAALDVGRDQLHPTLRADPRVIDLSPLNARALTADRLPAPPDLIVSDVSFISLVKALPAPLSLAAPEARLIALVKPQFEVGPERVGKGGLVKDPGDRRSAVDQVARFLERSGWVVLGETESPIAGGGGAREHLIAARRRT